MQKIKTGCLFITLFLWNIYAQAFWVLNNPYPDEDPEAKIYYSSFSERPKTLDPAKSYSANEYQFIGQIYEPLLQYDYFIRPYTLSPLIATQLPQIRYLDAYNNEVKADSKVIQKVVYTLCIQPNIFYQPHPALAKNKKNHYIYHKLDKDYLEKNDINQLQDFKKTGTRELTIDDYIYQIKRLANPAINSPLYGLLSEHILGFKDFGKSLPSAEYIDLRNYPLSGISKISDYCMEIALNNPYAQFAYWLAMPFFSPIPWEAEVFYSQPGMQDANISFDWYPIGTGAFMLTENNPNRRMILEKNPNYRLELFPSHASAADEKAGYLKNAGKRLPLVDKAMYILEKETIPRWNKFLQGYFDSSGVATDSFDQAIRITANDELSLTPSMQDKKLYLEQMNELAEYYIGFNMLDPIVGGYSEKAQKLRQAISIAVNVEEQIAIFLNGRGRAAQGPLPPGIFGYLDNIKGINPYVYQWVNNKPVRLSLDRAKQLLKEAGYPGGMDPKTGQALILNYDIPLSGSSEDKAKMDWMRKQFAKLGIDLNVRATLYNQFQDKMRKGNAQIYAWGWYADYPDPENFFFLLYGPNGKVKHGGENASNYQNPTFDALFNTMKNQPNDLKRERIIEQMLAIVRQDSPWIWGVNTESLILSHDWMSKVKPNTIGHNTLKYVSIDVNKRNQMREAWNKPLLWPLLILGLLFIAMGIPLYIAYRRKEKKLPPRMH